ncbi:MAG: hypothetical protein ACKVS9_13960 [Phycisphaerae bacterium]
MTNTQRDMPNAGQHSSQSHRTFWAVLAVVAGVMLFLGWWYVRQLACLQLEGAKLGSLGSGLAIYANEHNGAFPPTLDDLLSAGLTTREVLISANAKPGVAGCHFFYVSDLTTSDPPLWIAAYSDFVNAALDRVVVLRVCGTVDTMTVAEFRRNRARCAAEFESVHGRMPRVIPPRYE